MQPKTTEERLATIETMLSERSAVNVHTQATLTTINEKLSELGKHMIRVEARVDTLANQVNFLAEQNQRRGNVAYWVGGTGGVGLGAAAGVAGKLLGFW